MFFFPTNMSTFTTLILFTVLFIVVLKIYNLVTHADCKSKVCLMGKTALVTGGNSGIGYQIVLALAQRGCRVIIVDKNEDSKLLENIFKETKNRNVLFKYADLSSFSSVRALAKYINTNEEKLDILINNAGIANVSKITEDGFDMILQVNYLSAFLLTCLISESLKKAGGRVIFTSSAFSYIHRFSLEKIKPEVIESTNSNYTNSKLCLIIAADIFAEKLKKYGVISNCYHPGLVYTNIFNAYRFEGSIINGIGVKMLSYLAFLIGKTAEEGAQTAIYLASAHEVDDVTGQFFFEIKTTFKPRLAHNKQICHAVWELTECLVKLKPNEKL